MGTPGRVKWQCGLLHHIEITDWGRLLITDWCGYGTEATPGRFPCPGARTVVLDTDLNWLDEWPATGVEFTQGDTLYTCGEEVVLYDVNTGEEKERGQVTPPPGGFQLGGHQIAVDEDGNIYAADEALLECGSVAQRRGGVGAIRRYTRGQS